MGQQRRKYTDDYKAGAVERLYEPGATQGCVAKELGITGPQLKTWRLCCTNRPYGVLPLTPDGFSLQ
ncbi:transposase [Octadecabacter antarcticus]|uniref:transposase n=1 Tax=Octadecabacter antarcticus TaxID=1217908 RepID=UPI0009FF793D|nr:transposase [Octadecabacter antarcticus]